MGNESIVQTGVGFARSTLLRLDRLRAVTGRSRSHLLERLVASALDAEEAKPEVAEELARFGQLADGAGMSVNEYTEKYVKTFGMKTFPPTVDQLAEIGFGQQVASAPKRKDAGARATRETGAAGAPLTFSDGTSMESVPVIKTLRDIQAQQEQQRAEREGPSGR